MSTQIFIQFPALAASYRIYMIFISNKRLLYFRINLITFFYYFIIKIIIFYLMQRSSAVNSNGQILQQPVEKSLLVG